MGETLAEQLSAPFRVSKGRGFRLADYSPKDRAGIKDKDKAHEVLQMGIQQLREMHEKLWAQDKWAVLLIFQAMDAAGKDGVIKHVTTGLNPQGVDVSSFKVPSREELDHDYMWRYLRRMPERGRIGVFNRSYYEETLVVRVHENLLRSQHIPPSLITPEIWEERFEDINAIERYLARNGVVIRKFFLNVSRKEQKKRFLERLDEPAKNWKFSASDAKERQHWDEYQAAYEDMIRHTATPHAPWYVVPADSKWVTRLVVAAAVVDTMQELDLKFPKLDKAALASLDEARKILESEDDDEKPGKERPSGDD
jgi:PPK2 family polyphosphate:nucleotide phosphotransferase